MAMNTRRITATVHGVETFPIEMLHADSCFPATEADAHAIGRVGVRRQIRVARVFEYLDTLRLDETVPFAMARWASFGWFVSEIEVTQDPPPTGDTPAPDAVLVASAALQRLLRIELVMRTHREDLEAWRHAAVERSHIADACVALDDALR